MNVRPNDMRPWIAPEQHYSELVHELEKHNNKLEEVYKNLADLKEILIEVTHDYRREPNAEISSYAAPRGIISNALLLELTQAGYGFNIPFPRSAALSATTGVRHSVFNTGGKTIIIHQITLNAQTALANFTMSSTFGDPATTLGGSPTNLQPSYNRKIGQFSGISGVNASFDTTPQTLASPTPYVDTLFVGANSAISFFDPSTIYVLPAGYKTGLMITATSSGAPLVTTTWHVVELPF